MNIEKILLFIILVVVVCCLLYWFPVVLCGTSYIFNTEPINKIKKIFVTGGNTKVYFDMILHNIFGDPNNMGDSKLHVYDGENLYGLFKNFNMCAHGCIVCRDYKSDINNGIKDCNTKINDANRNSNIIAERQEKRKKVRLMGQSVSTAFKLNNHSNFYNSIAYKKTRRTYDFSEPNNNKDHFIFVQKDHCSGIEQKRPILKYINTPILPYRQMITHFTNISSPPLDYRQQNMIAFLSFDTNVNFNYNIKMLVDNACDLMETIIHRLKNNTIDTFISNSKFNHYLDVMSIEVGSDIFLLLNDISNTYLDYIQIPKDEKTDDEKTDDEKKDDKKKDVYDYGLLKSDLSDAVNSFIDDIVANNYPNNISRLKEVYNMPSTYIDMRNAIIYIRILIEIINKHSITIDTIKNLISQPIIDFNNIITTANILFHNICKLKPITINTKLPVDCTLSNMVFSIDDTKINDKKFHITKFGNSPYITGKCADNIKSFNTLNTVINTFKGMLNNFNARETNFCYIYKLTASSVDSKIGNINEQFYRIESMYKDNIRHTVYNDNKDLQKLLHILKGYDDFIVQYIKSIYGSKCDMYTGDRYSDFLLYLLLNRTVEYKVQGSRPYFRFITDLKLPNTGLKVGMTPTSLTTCDIVNFNNIYYGFSTTSNNKLEFKDINPITPYYDYSYLFYGYLIQNFIKNNSSINKLYISHNNRITIPYNNYDNINKLFKLSSKYLYSSRSIIYNIDYYVQMDDDCQYKITDGEYDASNNNNAINSNKNNKSDHLLKPGIYHTDREYDTSYNTYLFMGYPSIIYNLSNNLVLNKSKNIVVDFGIYNEMRDYLFNDLHRCLNNISTNPNPLRSKYPQMLVTSDIDISVANRGVSA
jgi:hypothetical protein